MLAENSCVGDDDRVEDQPPKLADLDTEIDWDFDIVVVTVVETETWPSRCLEIDADASLLTEEVTVTVTLLVLVRSVSHSVSVCVGDAVCGRVRGDRDDVTVAVAVMLRLSSVVTVFVLERSRENVQGDAELVGDLLCSSDGVSLDEDGVVERVGVPLSSDVGVGLTEAESDTSFVDVPAVFEADCCHDDDGVFTVLLCDGRCLESERT